MIAPLPDFSPPPGDVAMMDQALAEVEGREDEATSPAVPDLMAALRASIDQAREEIRLRHARGAGREVPQFKPTATGYRLVSEPEGER